MCEEHTQNAQFNAYHISFKYKQYEFQNEPHSIITEVFFFFF